MPTDNNNRNAFLRALLNQRRLTEASGGVLVNPSVPQPTVEVDETTPAPQVGSDVDFEAAIETQPTTKLSNNIATYDPEKAKDQSSDNWFVQAWDTITGFLDGITFNLIGGVLNFGESILDFASNTIGWIGDATGWYDSDPFTNWAKKDYATMTAEWMKTYANATPWGAINSIRSLAEYGADEYFGSASNTLGDITSSFFTNDDLDTTIESFDAYYAGDDSFYDTQTGQVIGSIANSIGFMLPSIALGAVTGGAGTVVSLASMGLASAGQGTEEALGEGASAGEALGYGLASGAVETATEIVVGPALKFVGLGTGKVMGVVGKTATKSFAKALGQTMFEEGMEEVVSAIAQPLIQSIYKGEDAFKDDEGNNVYASTDFWFGTNGHFAESVAGSFIAGAAAGGIMGGVSLKQQYNTFSADGIDTIEKFGEVVKADNKMAKLEQSSDFDANSKAYQQAVKDRQNALSEFTLAEDRLLASGSEKHIKNVARAILNPSQINTIVNSDTQSESEQISQLLTSHRDELQSHNKTYIRNSFNDIQRQYGTDYKLEFGKVKGNNEAYVNHDTKTIIINDSIVDKRGGSALAHEYIGHVLGTQLSSGSRTILYQDIVDTNWYKENETNLRQLYENDEIYNSFETSREKNAYWQEEVIANYMGDFFDGKNVASQIHELEKTFGNQNFLERFLNAVNNVTKFKGKNIAQKYRETIDKTIKGLLKTNSGKNNRILRTLKKFMNGEELSRSERNIQRQYKNLFELFSENNVLAQAYSKNGDLNTLSNERLISEIEKNEHLANIKQWKYFDKLSHKDFVKTARAARGEALTYDEVVEVQAVKEGIEYLDTHEDLYPEEHPELVEQTTNEFIDKIIKEAKAKGEVARDKKVLVLIGLPGAGKSVYAKEYMKQFGNAIELDNDTAKEVPCLSEYYNGGLGAALVQKIVSGAESNAIDVISKEGYNVVFPMIGKSERSIVNRLIDFEKAGYTIDLTYVVVDKNTSYTRTLTRFLDTGRFVSPNYINSIDESQIESIYNNIERTHEITYGNQTIHFQGTSKHDNRTTQKRFSRSSKEAGFFGEDIKDSNYNESRMVQVDDDGMVSNASEQRRKVNTTRSDDDARVDESNTTYEQTDEFRRIQEESRAISAAEQQLFHSGSKEIDETLRTRLSRTYEEVLRRESSVTSNGYGLLENTGEFKIYTNVNSQLFHDIFEINRNYLKNGELVDLHDNYDAVKCYLSSNGLSGFAIEPNGNLVSVFNLDSKKGFLRAISKEINKNTKMLDCYNSIKQPLKDMYSSVFGFKTASIMDYNMEYDHDNIAVNHNNPQVAFMVNADADVETKHFGKDDYDAAKNYQMSFVNQTNNNSNQAHLNLAISYDDTIDYEQYKSKFKELRPKLERDVKQLSNAFNFDAALSNAIGGWTFTDNANTPSIAGEPSFPISINNYQNIEDVKLFASILADTAYEVQNVVGVIEYNKNGTSTEFELPITKIDNGLKEILKKVNFDGFTIDTEAKTITIDTEDSDKIILLAEELLKHDYYDDTRQRKQNRINADWLDVESRAMVYRTWLSASSNQHKEGLLRRYVEKAQKVNQYILDNLDENGQRLPNTINNSDDILRHLRTSAFKSVDTVKDIIQSSKEFIESKLGDEYIVSMSQNLRDLSRKSFSAINDRASLLRQTNDVMDLLLDTRVEYLNPNTHTYEYVGVLSEFLNDEQTQEVRNKLQDLISSASNSQVRNRSARDFEITISRLLDNVKENNVKADRSIVLNNLRTRIRKNIDRYYQITSNDIERNGLKMLLAPFEQIHNRRGFSSRDLKANLRKALEWYNEDYLSKNNISLSFSSELRDKLLELYDSIGEPKVQTLRTGQTREVYGALTTESINLAIDSIRLINSEIRNMLVEYETVVKPAAEQSYKVIEGLTRNDTGLVRKLLNSYHRSFAPAYSVIRSILGPNSYLSNLLTRDMQIAENNRSLYVGDIMSEQVNKKIKELGIKPRTLTNARLEIAGQDLSITQAMYLYNSLNVEANFNAIDENGLQYKNKNGQLSKLFGKGEAQNILDELETKLDKPYKKLANHMLSIMNGQIKQDYIAWYESRYGKFQGRNEIGNVGENTYWMLLRSYNRYNDVEKAVSNPSAVFSRARSRAGSSDAVFIGDVFSAFEHYVNQFATEQFLKPVYRQASQILRTKLDGKGAKTVYELLNQKYGLNGKDVRYLETTMKDVLGALQMPREGILNRISSMYAISKLSLNVGSVLKQFTSIWTSNIPIAKSTKAAIARLTRNSAARSEYNQLIDRIGGLKYRERNAGVIQANVGSYSDRYRNIISKGMIGLSKADFFTVGTGVYSLMYIAQDQYGYKIGTEENMNFVVEHWSDFELTQSGNTPLQRSALFRGDLGSIAKSLFGFLQGENRAILGSFIEKISLYRQFRNVNQNEVKNNLNEARSKLELAENEYRASPENENLRNAYIAAQADYFDAEVRNKNFERFNVMGGNKIPMHMLAGMTTQAIFIALINELMRHLRGKEEWDEWDFVNVGIDAVTSMTVDWVPLANVIANLIQGYDVTVPVIDLLNQMSSLISSAQNGSFSMPNFIQLLSDLTGVPLTTLISYSKGITNAFAPEIALEIDNFMYGVTSTSMSNSMKEYRDKGNRERVSMFVKENIERFKTGYISERVQTELTNLYLAGYNALPKDYITTYVNENGLTISLSASQISAFKMAYDDSDKAIRELLTTSEYLNMTQEEKANAIKKIYDYFFEYAKAKVLKTEATNKVVNLLLQTNGSIAIGKYISILSRIQSIKASSTKSRKELVLDYINSMSNLSRQEKLLVMYLAGYGLSEESTNTLKRYLISKGISASDVHTLLKV